MLHIMLYVYGYMFMVTAVRRAVLSLLFMVQSMLRTEGFWNRTQVMRLRTYTNRDFY